MRSFWLRACVLLALAGTAWPHCARKESGAVIPLPAEPVAQAPPPLVPGHPLGLDDEEFWGNYRRTEKAVMARLEREGFRGILIDAPARVNLDSRDTLPLIGWHVRTLRQDRTQDLAAQALVAAGNLDTGQVAVGLAFKSGKMPAPRPAATDRDPGEGTTMNMFEIDLRKALDLPWRRARYSVVMILHDRVSNPVAIELESSKTGSAPETALPSASTGIRPAPSGTGGYPNYLREEASPALPAEAGIRLRVERVGVSEKPQSTLLRGSYRLPAAPQEIAAGASESAGGNRPNEPRPIALLLLTLILTAPETPEPFVLRVQVPSYDAIEGEGRIPIATGFFNLDLLRLEGMPRGPMTFYLYALHGAAVAGPVTIVPGPKR